MKGDLIINGKDAWEEYRMNLEDGSVFELGNAYPKKGYVESNIRGMRGRIIRNDSLDDLREITLVFHIVANSTAEMFSLFNKFIKDISSGAFTITSALIMQKFTLRYRSCSPVSNRAGIGKFSLKCIDNCSVDEEGVVSTYEKPEVIINYDILSALGGYAKPNISYRQKVTKTNQAGVSIEFYTSLNAKIRYSSGILDKDGNPTGVYYSGINSGDIRTIATGNVTVSMNGKVAGASYEVKQDGLNGYLLADEDGNLLTDRNGTYLVAE